LNAATVHSRLPCLCDSVRKKTGAVGPLDRAILLVTRDTARAMSQENVETVRILPALRAALIASHVARSYRLDGRANRP
jgi:hypothetical protein